jgi:hypothetical protein
MRANKGIQKDVWICLFEDGGRWTPDDILEHFGEKYPTLTRPMVGVILRNMVDRCRSLERFKQDGRVRFGVTLNCATPVGVKLAELVNGAPEIRVMGDVA